MTTSAEAVWQNLPSVYRRMGTATPAYGLAVTAGRLLVDLERTAQDVLRAHHLNNATDLEDLRRLGAWFKLEPWPEEDKEAFRTRLRRMAAIYREGAANAARMLDLLAVTMSAEIAAMDGPAAVPVPQLTWQEAAAELAKPPASRRPTHVPWPKAATIWAELLPEPAETNPYATYGIFTRKVGEVPWGIPAAVLDMPLHKTLVELKPDAALGRLEWQVLPPYRTLGDDPADDTYGDPVVTIFAPATNDVILPVLVQRDLRRAVLVNRRIPKGGAVQVDLMNLTVADVAIDGVPASTLHVAGKPDLLFGAGGILGEHKLGSGPPPYKLLKWYEAADLRRTVPTGDVETWLNAPDPQGRLPWPPLLTPLTPGNRKVPWRLLLADAKLNPLQPVKTNTVEKLVFAMEGRRAGTFTLVFDENWVLHGDDGSVRQHRMDWLMEQVHRLKLAGVVYLAPEQVTEELHLPAAMPLGSAQRDLLDQVGMVDTVETFRELFLEMAEVIATGDGLDRQLDAFVALDEKLAAGDSADRQADLSVALDEQLIAADSPDRMLDLTRSLTESLAAADQPQPAAEFSRQLADSIGAVDKPAAQGPQQVGTAPAERVILKDTVETTVQRRS
jgi:hypothetical protein